MQGARERSTSISEAQCKIISAKMLYGGKVQKETCSKIEWGKNSKTDPVTSHVIVCYALRNICITHGNCFTIKNCSLIIQSPQKNKV